MVQYLRLKTFWRYPPGSRGEEMSVLNPDNVHAEAFHLRYQPRHWWLFRVLHVAHEMKDITLSAIPRRDLLILPASFNRTPVVAVSFWRSEPARSIKLNLDSRILTTPPSSLEICDCITRVKMAWLRLLSRFMLVDAIWRYCDPRW
jgi:hypothetical protein